MTSRVSGLFCLVHELCEPLLVEFKVMSFVFHDFHAADMSVDASADS